MMNTFPFLKNLNQITGECKVKFLQVSKPKIASKKLCPKMFKRAKNHFFCHSIIKKTIVKTPKIWLTTKWPAGRDSMRLISKHQN